MVSNSFVSESNLQSPHGLSVYGRNDRVRKRGTYINIHIWAVVEQMTLCAGEQPTTEHLSQLRFEDKFLSKPQPDIHRKHPNIHLNLSVTCGFTQTTSLAELNQKIRLCQ